MNVSNYAITSYRFQKGVCLPTRIEVDGISYHIREAGIRLRVASSKACCTLMSFTDGLHVFHMRSRGKGGVWELVKIA